MRLRTKLISWTLDIVCYSFVFWIVRYSVYKYVNFAEVSRFFELPRNEAFALVWSILRQQPLPEAWFGPYMYLPGPHYIRLCQVHASGPDLDGLSLPMKRFPLDEAPPYRALSYTWGPAHGGNVPGDGDRLPLLVDGRNRSVPANLVRALKTIRSLHAQDYYWIDAVCIDQLNDRERSDQVSIMDKIYQRADVVEVWLGDEFEDTAKVNDILQDIIASATYPQRPPWISVDDLIPPDDFETLVQILSRRWFHRLWTLQEFALAKNVIMRCGNVVIDVGRLQKATELLAHHKIPLGLSYGNTHHATVATILQLSLLQSAVKTPDSMNLDFVQCFKTKSSGIDYGVILAWVYWRSIATFATDARDYVYGIVGVANAIAESMNLDYEPFHVNYALTTAEAYQAFIVYLMQGSFGLRAISFLRRTNSFPIHHPTDTPTHSLPSWVPDLASRNSFGMSANGGSVTSGDAFHCLDVFDERSPRDPFMLSDSKLHVRGHHIGKVGITTGIFPDDMDWQKCTNYLLTYLPILTQLPTVRPYEGQAPVDVLVDTLRMGSPPTGSNSINSTFIEAYLTNSVELFVWAKRYQHVSIDDALQILTHIDSTHNIWSLPGLSADFPSAEQLRWTLTRLQAEWTLFEIPPSIVTRLRAVRSQFHRLRQEFGGRISETKIFLLETSASSGLMGDTTKLMGVGSELLQEGDDVYAVSGSEWPLIIRGQEAGESTFIGEAYVHGIMHGELFKHGLDAPHYETIVLA